MDIFIGIILILHILLSYNVTNQILETDFLKKKQKRINIMLTWSIPFVWSFIVKNMIKSSDIEIMTKSNRKGKGGRNSDNWMHLTGGGDIGGNY